MDRDGLESFPRWMIQTVPCRPFYNCGFDSFDRCDIVAGVDNVLECWMVPSSNAGKTNGNED